MKVCNDEQAQAVEALTGVLLRVPQAEHDALWALFMGPAHGGLEWDRSNLSVVSRFSIRTSTVSGSFTTPSESTNA